MPLSRPRTRLLTGLFAALSVVALVLLRDVIATVFFAITVAYVLYPIRRWLGARGLGARVSAGIATIVAFLVGVVLLAPLAAVLYLRREELVAFFNSLPAQISVTVAEYTYTVDVEALQSTVLAEVGTFAVDLARAAPVLALKAFLFTLLVYALLLRPDRLRRALMRLVPGQYHDVAEALHERVRSTLYAIYVLQAATAFGTFCIGYVVFALLGYDSAFTLSAIAGILQFIPIIGPSVLVLALAGIHVVAGDVAAAILVAALGLVLIGFLPDALIRPRLAEYTLGLPGSLYFIGFTGGVLSIGIVGVIAGPLIVSILAAVAAMLANHRESRQQPLNEPTE